jgi:hypothetical protein
MTLFDVHSHQSGHAIDQRLRDEDLAGASLRSEMRGDIHRIAEGREVPRIVRTDHADEGRPRMDPGAEGQPWAFGRSIPGSNQERTGCIDGSPSMIRSCEEGQEQTDDRIAHELLDDRIVFDEHIHRDSVEAVHEPGELERRSFPCKLA